MVTAPMILASLAVLGGSETATWPIYFETTGGEVTWSSPTAVDPAAGNYNINASITTLAVDVSFGFFSFDDIDVTDQLPDSTFGGAVPGPCPVDGGTTQIDQPPTIAFDIAVGLDATGRGYLDMTNIDLGTASIDLPPFGEITVQIDRLKVGMDMTVEAEPTIACRADLDGSGVVDVNDLLAVIETYGGSDPGGDVTGDGQVDVDDVLTLINVYGSSCP